MLGKILFVNFALIKFPVRITLLFKYWSLYRLAEGRGNRVAYPDLVILVGSGSGSESGISMKI